MEALIRQSPLNIISVKGKYIELEHGYRVEIENEALFKLSHEGSVIAPFDDGPELIAFVLMDMELNGLG